MTPQEDRFVDLLGETLAAWNLPRATGRVYGLLLLRGAPSRSEDLRTALSLSSGAVSTAVRELVSWGLASTIPQPGSRRLLIEAVGGFDQLLAASHARSRTFVDALRSAEALADSPEAVERLRDVSALFTTYVDAGERALASAARPTASNPLRSRRDPAPRASRRRDG